MKKNNRDTIENRDIFADISLMKEIVIAPSLYRTMLKKCLQYPASHYTILKQI